jgi:hypothetical protein
LLLARQITSLHALLALEPALLCLQQPLLRALRPPALGLARLQLLHTLLQAIDALLALRASTRKDFALPVRLLESWLCFLESRLSLLAPLRALFDSLLRALLDALLSRRARAHSGPSRPARLYGDLRPRTLRRRRALPWCGDALAEPGSRPCNARRRRAPRCGHSRRRARRHRRTPWWSRTDRRRGRPRHSPGGSRTRHGRGRSRTGQRTRRGGWRCRRTTAPLRPLGVRADARQDHRDAKNQCCNANAGRKHDRLLLFLVAR